MLARAARGPPLLRPRRAERPPRRPHAPPAARLRGWELGERRDGDGGGALGLLDGAAQLLGAVLAQSVRARVLGRPRPVARRRSRSDGPPAARLRGELGGLAGDDLLLAGWPRAAPQGLSAARMPDYELHAAAKEGRPADLAAGIRAKDAEGTLAAGTPCRPTQLPAALSALSHSRRVCVAAALAEREGGPTPLRSATMCKQPEGAAADGVRLLVAAGADATAKDGRLSGYATALHTAAKHGPDDPSLAGLLLGAGCDPAAKHSYGDTALDGPSKGKTALDLAKSHNKPRMAALLEAVAADPEATLAPFRAEFDALRQLVREQGLEAGLAAVASEEERLAAVRRAMPEYDETVQRVMQVVENSFRDLVTLHGAAEEGQLEDLAAAMLAKDAEGTLAAGAPCRAPPDSPCPLSPAPGLRGGSAGGAEQPQ
eukprot:COSAG04_NODE_1754_length_5687_cov_2.326593_11_plen_428_part_01